MRLACDPAHEYPLRLPVDGVDSKVHSFSDLLVLERKQRCDVDAVPHLTRQAGLRTLGKGYQW